MDSVTLVKMFSALLYPLGMVSVGLLLAGGFYVFGKRGIARASLLGAMVVLWISSTPYIARALTLSLERQHPILVLEEVTAHDAIVVLGGGLRLPVEPAGRSQFTHATDRYWYARALFNKGKAPMVILSGGNVYEQPGIRAESFYAKRLMQEWGVPNDALKTDEMSRTTAENAQAVRALLAEAAVKADGAKIKVLLVTSAMHMPRARYLFSRALGDEVVITPAVADVVVTKMYQPSIFMWLPNAGALELTTRALHEWYGLWYAQIR